MAINPIDFLNFAKSLPNKHEIDIRTAMSRSYYAAYHACNLKFHPSNSIEGGMHAKLIKSLTSSPVSSDKSIGYMLRQLKGERVKADYYLNSNVSSNESEAAIVQSEKIIDKINMGTQSPISNIKN